MNVICLSFLIQIYKEICQTGLLTNGEEEIGIRWGYNIMFIKKNPFKIIKIIRIHFLKQSTLSQALYSLWFIKIWRDFFHCIPNRAFRTNYDLVCPVTDTSLKIFCLTNIELLKGYKNSSYPFWLECGRTWPSQTKDIKIGTCCFSAKQAALRCKSKDWLTQSQKNVFG